MAHTEIDDEWKPAASTSLVTCICEEHVRMNILVHSDSGDVEHARDSLLSSCQPEPIYDAIDCAYLGLFGKLHLVHRCGGLRGRKDGGGDFLEFLKLLAEFAAFQNSISSITKSCFQYFTASLKTTKHHGERQTLVSRQSAILFLILSEMIADTQQGTRQGSYRLRR